MNKTFIFALISSVILFVILWIGCGGYSGRCNNDLDCPRDLVCRNNRCVGIYEIYDIESNYDLFDYGNTNLGDMGQSVEVVELSDYNSDDVEDSDVNTSDDSLDAGNGTADIIQTECTVDLDCKSEYKCVYGGCVNYHCEYLVIGGYCLIDQHCYLDGEINPLNECLFCNSNINSKGWSSRDGAVCTDDGYECTYDICNGGSCIHPNKWREKCSKGICDGSGNCVQCLTKEDCDSSQIDVRCESVDCINNECVYEKRLDGSGCGPESAFYCYICNNGRCECNYPNYNCASCLPSCGLLGGVCCGESTFCSIREKGKSYDCYLCCEGECIPY